MKTLFIELALVFVIGMMQSCAVEPKEINYGSDHCHLCDMTVVDKGHAAEYVTKKGKAYFFDAVECLVREINQNKNEEDLQFILVADYSNPGKLVDARNAFYLISEKIKSPMGANLSAFEKEESANKFKTQFGGKILNWEELKKELP